MKISNWKNIPFYGNSADNTHCYQAVIKMLLKFYFPEEEYSWKKLEKVTGKRPGKWTWPTRGWLHLTERGLSVSYYGTFDYEKFIEHGSQYLIQKYGEKVGSKQVQYSDIDFEIETAKKIFHEFTQIKRSPDLKDIADFLKQDCTLICNLNYFSLYGKEGYAGHFVLIYGIDQDYIYLHDPGLPPNPNAAISIQDFSRAWEYSGVDNKGLTVVSRITAQ